MRGGKASVKDQALLKLLGFRRASLATDVMVVSALFG